MGPDLNAVGKISYRDRRLWLIGFGVVEILLAGLLWVVSAAQLFPSIFPWQIPIPSASDPVFAFIFYGGLGAWFLAIGIGSIQCRNWARVAMLVVGGVWFAVGAASSLFLAFLIPKIVQPSSGRHLIRYHDAYMVTLGGLVFFLVAMPVVFIGVYSERNVRATCLAEEQRRSPGSSA